MAITNMNIVNLSREVMWGFFRNAAFLKGLSTRFEQGVGDKLGLTIKVPLVTAGTVHVWDQSVGYEKDDPNITGIDVSIANLIYVCDKIDDIAALSMGGYEQFRDKYRANGAAVAARLFTDLTTLWGTAGNNNGTPVVVDAATFDSDTVADLSQAARKVDPIGLANGAWTLILDDALYASLLKDPAIKDASAFASNSAIRDAEVIKLFGLNIVSAVVAGGGGWLVNAGATALGSQVIVPSLPDVANMVETRRIIADPDSGLNFRLKEWYNPNMNSGRQAIELFYGAKVAQPTGIIQITVGGGA